jgi:glycosyltransferase involved in cell wall biosynthesis
MRICIVTHKLLKGDGQARVNYELVRELQSQNHQVVLLATDVAEELLAHPGTEWVKVPVKGWPTQLLKNMVFSLLSTWRLLPLKRMFDLIMVNGFITWARSDVNAVHFVHSSWLRSPAHPFRLKKNLSGLYQLLFTSINSLLEKVAFTRTGHLVPVSEKVRKEVERIGVRADIRVIMNGVDIREFSPEPVPGTSRKELGLPEEVPLALFAGDIKSSRKNLDSVLKAMLPVKGLHLAVAGSTAGSPYIKLAEQLGLQDRVHFLGFRRDISQIMKNADFFVFPSRYEACTLAVIEALAAGLPVITTYQSGVSELIESEQQAGFVLANPEDVIGLQEAMLQLTASTSLRKRLGANARSVAERQSWERVARSYIDLFHEVLARKKTYSGARVGSHK